jgi:hypothetical protein
MMMNPHEAHRHATRNVYERLYEDERMQRAAREADAARAARATSALTNVAMALWELRAARSKGAMPPWSKLPDGMRAELVGDVRAALDMAGVRL